MSTASTSKIIERCLALHEDMRFTAAREWKEAQEGRKVIGYDRFREGDKWKMHPELDNLPAFPLVAVVTHGQRRLLNLAQAIIKHRRQEVVYYLALWEDLMAPDDILTAPAWLIVTPEGKIVGQEPGGRQPLLAAEGKARN